MTACAVQALNPYLGKLLALLVQLLAEDKYSALFQDAVSALDACHRDCMRVHVQDPLVPGIAGG